MAESVPGVGANVSTTCVHFDTRLDDRTGASALLENFPSLPTWESCQQENRTHNRIENTRARSSLLLVLSRPLN
jgi:hypothetical protein